ncbi:hypothetical protein [Rubinisphaera margarita]|uniref:hypothetical protein n=1 Tax=Rubinisphaera margarita TaxID=2909586 RepID=UPI001EE8864E|nr:hypothetical protein [Rubinisphaera margarita]MCG6157110.1 hypothetical protein [Rubinisphaera margarita]
MVFTRNGKRPVVHLQSYDLTIDIEMATSDKLFRRLEQSDEDLDAFVADAIETKLKGGAA